MKNNNHINTVPCSLTTEWNEEFNAEVLNSKEASRFLKVSISTLYRQTRRNLIPARKFGGQIRYLKQDLIRWLKGELNE